MRSLKAALKGLFTSPNSDPPGAPEPAPADGPPGRDEALEALQAGDFAGAIECCTHSLAAPDLNPRQKAQLLALRGLARASANSSAGALEDFAAATRTDP